MTRTAQSARKELRAIIERAVAREAGLPEDAAARISNRILREADRIVEIGARLRTIEQPAGQEVSAAGAPREVFDPYAIGAVVTLHQLGREALMERLAGITRIEDLRSLAVAQNLSLPAAGSSAEEHRLSIVRGAEQRLAERRAAAS